MAKALQPVEAQTTKKPVIRSPKYPLLTFQSALTKAKVIYGYEKRVKTTIAVVLSHLGYSTQVGLPARVLSALLQYGLLEKAGEKVGISERAFKIFNLPEDSDERESLIREAALKPALFKELVNEYPTGLPSDAALKSYLVINKGFNENRIGEFFKVFKAAIDLAKPFDGDYTGDQQSEDESQQEESDMETPVSPPNKQSLRGHNYGPTLEMRRSLGENIPASYTEAINQRISDDCRVKVLFEGAVTQEAIQKLIKYLELGLDDYPTKEALSHRRGIWRNKDLDLPVTVIGEAGTIAGRRYVKIEGSDTGIPEDEVEFA